MFVEGRASPSKARDPLLVAAFYKTGDIAAAGTVMQSQRTTLSCRGGTDGELVAREALGHLA